ncbi:hypothetical protein ACSBR1_000566 [Camellia fascicularis]
MEGGLPMLSCLLQHTLRNLCTSSDSSTSTKWVYAVFWRILPRNYPPPKWDYGGGALDRAKGNKRNWILVWEDGFCNFYECERAGNVKGRFGADVFFKMSHEVYSYGEGMVGKVAADNSHKWVFKDSPSENDSSFITSWNVPIDPVREFHAFSEENLSLSLCLDSLISLSHEQQPRAWQFQFHSGIQTIALISVREGIIQLGSFDKIVEDLNLVISIQRKFSYIQSIPGIYAIQRPYQFQPIQYPYTFKPINNHTTFESHDDKCHHLTGTKRLLYGGKQEEEPPLKSLSLGYNTTTTSGGGAPPPPLFPSMPCSLGALLSKVPFVVPNYHPIEAIIESRRQSVKVDNGGGLSQIIQVGEVKVEVGQEEKSLNPKRLGDDGMVGVELGFGTLRQGQSVLNLN